MGSRLKEPRHPPDACQRPRGACENLAETGWMKETSVKGDGRPMTEEPTKTEPTGVFQCEGLAFAILHAFAERLSTEAEKTDGAIKMWANKTIICTMRTSF